MESWTWIVISVVLLVIVMASVAMLLFAYEHQKNRPDRRAHLPNYFLVDSMPAYPHWEQWGTPDECQPRAKYTSTARSPQPSFGISVVCAKTGTPMVCFENEKKLVLYGGAGTRIRPVDTWETDEFSMLPVLAISPHGRYVAVPFQGFAYVIPIHNGEFDKTHVTRVVYQQKTVLQVQFDDDDDESLYVAYADEVNHGILIHYRHRRNHWSETQIIHPLDQVDNDGFGFSLVARGRNLLVGSTSSIFHFIRHGRDDGWQHWLTIGIPDVANILWGSRLVLSEDECFLAIASPYDNIRGVERAGRVYCLRRSHPLNNWDPHMKLIASPYQPQENGLFGYRMCLQGSHLFVLELGDSMDASFVYHYDWRKQQLIQMFDHEELGVSNGPTDVMGMGMAVGLPHEKYKEASKPMLYVSHVHAEEEARSGLFVVLN